ncbi:MAG: cobalt-precorrin-5B (C(1))-methyltransferase [Rhodospirillaceae bacterium]|jgi:cobalt-precorrin-5B (C1)-methyltransferase|nr:cobalt-precorrin-5B (C(1))-methyltransferase [Rhodospirillaceae bacterium]MBT6117054.1 cobalt-precorrin-5B (C(1))-methyltransferase [Rhodospirillaceae bacterium]
MGRRPDGPLRRGWTTGACAAAAAAAAFEALATGRFPDPVTIRLPRGETPSFALAEHALDADCAEAGIVKDAGDDPDVTHGALVRARVARAAPGTGIRFHAGEGVGTVTRPGLALPVGEPAINPGPRALIRETLQAVAERCGRGADAEVTLSIPGGEALAERTANGRLGILGGLSILGTTGIVMPYSCAAWIHSIHRGIDVARAAGLDHVGAATGRTSEAALQRLYGLPDHAMIDMGDFAGAVLKYLRRNPLPRLSIAGGFGKLSKLAAGHLDLHSGRSRVDTAGLAELLADLGASAELVAAARDAASAGEVLERAGTAGRGLAEAVARRAREVALAALSGDITVEVLVFARNGELLGRAGAP